VKKLLTGHREAKWQQNCNTNKQLDSSEKTNKSDLW
jgi:hypothetical protein